MRLYGPSDVQRVVINLPDGTSHRFDFGGKRGGKREPAPGYVDGDKRSLPIIDTQHPEIITWLERNGWSKTPTKVTLTTDEREYVERAKEEGDVNARLMAATFGKELAQLAATKAAQQS